MFYEITNRRGPVAVAHTVEEAITIAAAYLNVHGLKLTGDRAELAQAIREDACGYIGPEDQSVAIGIVHPEDFETRAVLDTA